MPVSQQMDISTLPYPWKHFFPGAFSGLAELLSSTYPGLHAVLSQAESGADNTGSASIFSCLWEGGGQISCEWKHRTDFYPTLTAL